MLYEVITVNTLRHYLKDILVPACNAGDIMTREVDVVPDSYTVMESSLFMRNNFV